MNEDKQKITEKRAAMFSSAGQDCATPLDLVDVIKEEAVIANAANRCFFTVENKHRF